MIPSRTGIRKVRRGTTIWQLMNWHLYMLQCEDASLYTGIALNVQQRLAQHQAGKGSRYVRSKGRVKLIYVEPHKTKSAALCREREIKSWSRKKKLALISDRSRAI